MNNPKKTLENLTKYGKNPDFARHSLDMEKTDHLEGIKEGTDKVAEAIKSIPKTEFPEKMKMELVGAEIVTIKGEKGDKGDKGDKGEDGETPQRGVDYLLEEEIEDYLKRITPQKGIHYFDGADGLDGKDADEEKIIKAILAKIPKPKDGKDGKNGKDAEPLKSEIIVRETIKHLTSLKGNDRPSLKMFRESDDLLGAVALHKNMMSKMPRSLLDGDQRWHGGGITSTTLISNEVPTGSSTTFTLANTPQSGTVQVYAQGQRLSIARGDYTISGNIITTTGSWNAGDIEVSYVLFGN